MAATRRWIRYDSAVAIVRGVHRVAPHFCSTLHELRLDGYETKPFRPLILRREGASSRAKQQYRLFEKMRAFVDEVGYDPKRIPLKLLLPALDYASVEED